MQFQLPRAKNTSALSKGGFARFAKGIGEAVSKMTNKMIESDPVKHTFNVTWIVFQSAYCI